MVKLQCGDLVTANNKVEDQGAIDYFPWSNIIESTTLTPEGDPTPLVAGRLGYVHTCYTGEDSGDPNQKEEMCLVDFTDWGDTPEGDEIITATLPRSFLELDTHFDMGDRVVAREIVEYRLDKLLYDSLSATRDETSLALLREGLEGLVVNPDVFLDVDFSFRITEEDVKNLPEWEDRTNFTAGERLTLLVTVPPTFVRLVEKVAYELRKNPQEDE